MFAANFMSANPHTIVSGPGSMCSAHRAYSPGHAVTIPFANTYLAASPAQSRW